MVELDQEVEEEQQENGAGIVNTLATEKAREDQAGRGGGTLMLTVIIIEVGMEYIQVVNLIYVIGANNSSNSLRLVEVGKKSGCNQTHLISDISEVDWQEIEKEQKIGLTAGASAPDILIQDFIDKMNQLYDVEIKNISVADENITFKIPRELNER